MAEKASGTVYPTVTALEGSIELGLEHTVEVIPLLTPCQPSQDTHLQLQYNVVSLRSVILGPNSETDIQLTFAGNLSPVLCSSKCLILSGGDVLSYQQG